MHYTVVLARLRPVYDPAGAAPIPGHEPAHKPAAPPSQLGSCPLPLHPPSPHAHADIMGDLVQVLTPSTLFRTAWGSMQAQGASSGFEVRLFDCLLNFRRAWLIFVG